MEAVSERCSGVVGKALWIPHNLLLQQAGAAHLRDRYGHGFVESEWNSLGADNDGDSRRCNDMIMFGFTLYDEYFK